MEATPLWEPTQDSINNSNISKFTDYVNTEFGLDIRDYNELYNWSVNDIEAFWEAVWKFSGIIHSKGYSNILDLPENSNMFGAKWFQGSQLNFAENLLRYRDDHKAIIHLTENREPVTITYKELFSMTARLAASLKKLGVQKGDRVAGYISNVPEAIIAMLAASSIGAVWSSTSPDFGHQGVLDRFGQIRPKVLFAVDGYSYNGQKFDRMETIRQIKDEIPAIQNVVIIPKINDGFTPENGILHWDDLLSNDTNDIEFEQLPFDHPAYILYSSGTTGTPKCIVHGAGGTLLQHYKELALHTNLKRDDVIFFYTTCGWMMWNWLVSSLSVGATIFLYEGSPFYPDPYVLWRAVEEVGINIFGTSPKFLSASEKIRLKPAEKNDLSSLKVILSTGAPLSRDNFNWVYEKINKDIQLSSISGGTDIVSCFMLGCPVLPVHSEEIQTRGLGMKVEAWDLDGRSLTEQKGELVCTAPFPSMPVEFWEDPEGKKYYSSYFEHYPGIWRHGDYIRVTERGGVVVYGRSDSTLNPGGVRIGTAEIYRIVESMPGIMDSIVVGQKWKDDTRILLFVVLKEDTELDDGLIQGIKNSIKNELTPRHVPEKVFQIKEVPVTLNGKKVEIAVSNILNGEEVTNKSSLANPQSLDQFAVFSPQ